MLVLQAWELGIEIAQELVERIQLLSTTPKGAASIKDATVQELLGQLRKDKIVAKEMAAEEDREAGWMFTVAFHAIVHDLKECTASVSRPIGRLEVLKLLIHTSSETEWNAACDRIKDLHGGEYPDFWFELVLRTGLISRVAGVWALVQTIKDLLGPAAIEAMMASTNAQMTRKEIP